MKTDIPEKVKDIIVEDASSVEKAIGKCSVIFSAVEMDKQMILTVESEYAKQGFAVISNNSAHRNTVDVPVMIPEINADHLDIIPLQQKNHAGARDSSW